MDRIHVGMNVDIKRTDGRIHGALVSGVNPTSRSVTVEWFEKGETKGKEIEVEQLYGLNPQLISSQPPSNNNVTTVASSNEVSKSEITVDDKRSTRVTRRQAPSHPSVQQKQPANVPSVAQKARQTISKSTVGAIAQSTNGHSHPSQALADLDEEEDEYEPGVSRGGAAGKRKSNTVQEIERLQKNREERRARQEELRQQKAELMNVDPGNPNWEVLGMIREYREKLEFHPLRINDQIDDHQICVCVRKRPLNKKELARREIDVVTVPNRDHMIVHQPQQKVDLTKYLDNQSFRFDYAFDENSTNEMVYRFTAQPLVKTIFEQGFATCFAYGQTGSGKTHTMGGDFQGKSQEVSKGIYALTARDVFKFLNRNYKSGPKETQLTVSCSFFEIYSGKVFDLLNSKVKLRILEDGKGQVQVVGLREMPVESEQDVLELIRRGSDVRTAGQTSANNQSSRSHAVFQIILRNKASKKLHGKFSLVDLAGNERGADTFSSNRQTRMEGAEINKSLLALKECIRALGRRNAHLPFRASKLTLVLRDSFIGDNARTCMIAMISPGMNSVEHTLNTLRYANRVKELGADPEGMMKGASGSVGPQNGMEFDDLRSEDSDLALLHSHNEEELSNDLYEFQMMVDQMQQQEERVLDEHAKLIEETEKCLKHYRRLLKMTETVDYDTEQYAKEFRGVLETMMDKGVKVKEQVDTLLGNLQQEETAALKTTSAKKGTTK